MAALALRSWGWLPTHPLHGPSHPTASGCALRACSALGALHIHASIRLAYEKSPQGGGFIGQGSVVRVFKVVAYLAANCSPIRSNCAICSVEIGRWRGVLLVGIGVLLGGRLLAPQVLVTADGDRLRLSSQADR